MLSATAFILQDKCSQVQPCVFCKCYLHALSVPIQPTEFIKHLLWARCYADAVGKGLSFQLLEKNNVMVNAMIKRCTGMLWEGGAQLRLGVEIGQRGKPAWLGLEIQVEVGAG